MRVVTGTSLSVWPLQHAAASYRVGLWFGHVVENAIDDHHIEVV